MNNDEKIIFPKGKFTQGTGRRKRAIARIRLLAGSGEMFINNVKIDKKSDYTEPLIITDKNNKYDVYVKVCGGGIKSQIGAIKLGIARAIIKLDENLKPTLRKAGLLTRDPREKERKKPGLKRARRAPQWQKR